MNNLSDTSSNSRIWPYFAVLAIFLGAYYYDKKVVRTLSNPSKPKKLAKKAKSSKSNKKKLSAIKKKEAKGLRNIFKLFTTPFTKEKSSPRKGGWSQAQIDVFNSLTGASLKHGVDKDPKTLEDFKRKGSWATRHYKRKNTSSGLNMAPLVNKKGQLLPFSTQAIVWGEKPPKNRKQQKRLVKLGEKLLSTYQKFKKMGYKSNSVLPLSVRNKFKKGLRKKV